MKKQDELKTLKDFEVKVCPYCDSDVTNLFQDLKANAVKIHKYLDLGIREPLPFEDDFIAGEETQKFLEWWFNLTDEEIQ